MIFEIRLPTMSLEDFSKHVANTGILTDTEVRGLFTLLTGTKPKAPLPFPTKKRIGLGNSYVIEFAPITMITTEPRQVSLGQGVAVNCPLEINNLQPNERAYITEVYFCNPADFPFDDIRFSDIESTAAAYTFAGGYGRQGKVCKANSTEKMVAKSIDGCSVYKATFPETFALHSDMPHGVVKFNSSTFNGILPVPYICKTQVVGNNQNPRGGRGLRQRVARHSRSGFHFGFQPPADQGSFFIERKEGQITVRLSGGGCEWPFLVGLKIKIASVTTLNKPQAPKLSAEDMEYFEGFD